MAVWMEVYVNIPTKPQPVGEGFHLHIVISLDPFELLFPIASSHIIMHYSLHIQMMNRLKQSGLNFNGGDEGGRLEEYNREEKK